MIIGKSRANTITEKNRMRLCDLVAHFSFRDFKMANPTGIRNRKGFFNPYSPSTDTLEALRMYRMSLRDDLTKEQVKEIKAYLLLQRKYGNI